MRSLTFITFRIITRGNHRNKRQQEVLLRQRPNSIFRSFYCIFLLAVFGRRPLDPTAVRSVRASVSVSAGKPLSDREEFIVRGLLESRLSLGDVDLDAFGALGGGVLPLGHGPLGRHQSLSGLLPLLVGHRVAALLLPAAGFDLYCLLWCVGWSGLLLLLRTIISQLKCDYNAKHYIYLYQEIIYYRNNVI